jgi:hypothetical protein
MRSSVHTLLLAAVVVAVLAGVWFLFVWSGPQAARELSHEERTTGAETSGVSTSSSARASTDDSERSRAPVADAAAITWRIRVLEREKREPVAGARVRLSNGEWHTEGVSGADGTLELRAEVGSAAREADLAVDHPSFAPTRIASVKAGEARDVLLVRGGEIRGHCQPSPNAAADVLLFEQITENPSNWSVQHASSDARGEFRFAELRPGDYALTAKVSGWSAPSMFSVRVEAGVVSDITLDLTPEAVLHGRLLSAANQAPMPNVRVSITVGIWKTVWLPGASLPETVTGADGRFEIRQLFPAQCSLYFRAGDAPKFRRAFNVQHAGESIEQDFIAAPSVRFHGRIVEANKTLVPDAEVALVSDWSELAGLNARSFDASRHINTRSRADGTFEMTTLVDPGAQLYLLRRRSLSDSRDTAWEYSEVTSPRDGTEKDLGDVELAALRTIRGSVEDERGAPVAGASVLLTRKNGNRTASSTTSAEDGSFSIDAADSGSKPSFGLRIAARRAGFASDNVSVEKPSPDPIRLVLHPVRAVSGRVVDADGRGVPSLQVVLGTQLADHGRGPRIGGGDAVERTDEFGRFRFAEAVSMESEIGNDSRVQSDWVIESRDPAVIPADGDREVTVVVRRVETVGRATIRGRIVRRPGLEVLDAPRIEALPAKGDTSEPDEQAIPWGSKRRGILDFVGDTFTLSNVTPGRIVLVVACWHCSGATIPLEIRPGETMDVGDIELARTAEVWVKFVDASGRELHGVKFSVHPIDKPEQTLRGKQMFVGDNYIFDNLRCGESFELRVPRAGHDDAVQRFDVPFQPHLDVTVRLE